MNHLLADEYDITDPSTKLLLGMMEKQHMFGDNTHQGTQMNALLPLLLAEGGNNANSKGKNSLSIIVQYLDS
mgnify:CR=1 FL=1